MDKKGLYKLIQKHLADVSITNSSLRNQGAKGMVSTSRNFCTNLHLDKFNVLTQKIFDKVLDENTKILMNMFPKGASTNWGAARKSLNIFLRDVAYSKFLSKSFNSKVISFLEVPLDKDVATNIRKHTNGKNLPRWISIKTLKKEISNEYQEVANQIAKELKVHRIHLDLLFWRNKI